MNYFLKHKEGFILTLLIHLLLLFIVLRSEFFTPLPLPEEKGVLIDFGITPDGMGKSEPTPKEPAPPKIVRKQETPPPVPKPQPNEPTVAKEPVMTQDFEKTAALDEAKRKEDQKRQKQLEEDKRKRDSLQKINNERITELNRLAEIRRQDSLRQAAEEARISQINSRAKNVFGTSGQGTDNSSTGEGVTFKPGNQGSPDGTPGAKQYGSGGGEGVSFDLSGRSARSLPKPNYPGNEQGVVVVEISVDKYGKVTNAKPGVRGSTSLNPGLLEAARKAALIASFNQNTDAPAFQTGTITYRFVLD